MQSITSFRLNDLLLLKQWQDAEVGTLLQVRIADVATIGIRTKYPTANGLADVILALSSDARGLIAQVNSISPTAFDVSRLVEIRVENSPVRNAQGPIAAGLVYEHINAGSRFASGQLSPGVEGLVCITALDPKVSVGTCIVPNKARDFIVLGLTSIELMTP